MVDNITMATAWTTPLLKLKIYL